MLDVTSGPDEVHAAVAHDEVHAAAAAVTRVTACKKQCLSGEAEVHAAATRIKIAP